MKSKFLGNGLWFRSAGHYANGDPLFYLSLDVGDPNNPNQPGCPHKVLQQFYMGMAELEKLNEYAKTLKKKKTQKASAA